MAVTALLVGGGGLVAVNYAANASNVTATAPTTRSAQTISCPDVKGKLPAIPQQAQAEVDRNLQLLDRQTAEANQRLVDTRGQGGPNFVQNAILGPLTGKRKATIDRIAIAIGRTAARPTGLDALVACNLGLDAPGTQTSGGAANQSPGGAQGAGGNTGQQGNGSGAAGRSNDGPTAADFVDITKVAPNVRKVRRQTDASTGAFTSRCGVNKQGQHNSDNDIVAPGVSNGAHHVHDYVGKLGDLALRVLDLEIDERMRVRPLELLDGAGDRHRILTVVHRGRMVRARRTGHHQHGERDCDSYEPRFHESSCLYSFLNNRL
jgi:hypothetical protein